jgi:hypothetical protein
LDRKTTKFSFLSKTLLVGGVGLPEAIKLARENKVRPSVILTNVQAAAVNGAVNPPKLPKRN